MNDIKIKEGVTVTGKIKVDVFRAGYAELANDLIECLKMVRKLPPSDFKENELFNISKSLDSVKNEYFVRTAVECPNTVMDSPNYGIDLLIQWLVGIQTYPLTLSYIEIGTGLTTPAITDTALTTPTNRAAVGFQQDYATTDAIVQAIFSDSQLTNGTYYEMGTFCGGTGTIGTGQLFNHALFASPYTKSSGTDTTCEVDISFS